MYYLRQINNGFKDYYYLEEDGRVYNIALKQYVKIDKYKYRLQTIENKQKSISLKDLYKLVYNKIYCIDTIEPLENEIFKEIDDTDGLYFISNYGRVKSLCGYTAKLLKEQRTAKNYYRVQIIQAGELTNKFIHTLVANAFLGRPESIDCQVHHKDFNSLNNKADNLEYLRPKQHRKKHLERLNNVNTESPKSACNSSK